MLTVAVTLSIAYPRHTGNDPYSQGCQPGTEGGFATQAEAAANAEEVWRASKAGMNVLSDETVTEFLARWLKKKKTELKRTTAHEYERDIELYLVPHLGALKMRDLRARHCQGLFDWIISDSERREEHRARVAELKEAADRVFTKEDGSVYHPQLFSDR
ncbi:N-terminal phage integrase SAM-like domain-containing protein [Streptomyces kebangsaanensis]|uniref:N-terminal phage integrase SAM-like domain-containing protein n=1 Tax=Streptomyces kebangsaanensis TaxID=864058 RepID=UPI0009A0B4D1|nr:N-terminal phage integrase SAM-like domain-containing protein [Streptomyces kebangsaanensis]